MNYQVISQIPVFKNISLPDIEEILSKNHLQETLFRKGEILAMQDEPCNRLILLLTGSVKAEMVDPAGRVVKVEDIFAPNPLAILFLFGENNRFPVQAIAREDSKALIIPRQTVLKILSENQNVLRNYLDLTASFATRLSQKLHFMSFRTIRQKFSMYLLNLSKIQQSNEIKLDKSRVALAEYFGVSRPSLEREISVMQKDGLIVANKKTVVLSDKNKLMQIISF